MRPLRVKFILPALTEATSPYWRPIKYSLFPPLGLATLAAYLAPGRRGGASSTSTSSRSTLDDRPDLVVIQVYITNAYRAYRARRSLPRAGRVRRARRPARDLAARRGRARTPTRSSSARASRRSRSSSPTSAPAGPQRVYRSTVGPHARPPAADPPRSDRAPPLPRAELDRRHARLSAALRLLLQGRVLRRRPIVLHAARGRRARRDRAAARTPSLLPRRSSARRSPLRRGAVRRHARHEPAVPGRGDRRLDPARRPDRARRGGRPAQPLRRLRDADARRTSRAATSARTSAATTRP